MSEGKTDGVLMVKLWAKAEAANTREKRAAFIVRRRRGSGDRRQK